MAVLTRLEGLELDRQGCVLPPELELGDLVYASLADAQDTDDPVFVPVLIIVGGNSGRGLGVGMDGPDVIQVALGDNLLDLVIIGDHIVIGRFDDGRDDDLHDLEGPVGQALAEHDAVDLAGIAAGRPALESKQITFVNKESHGRSWVFFSPWYRQWG